MVSSVDEVRREISSIEPADGIAPLVRAINKASSRIEIAIFRFDRAEIEKALGNAVSRGVSSTR